MSTVSDKMRAATQAANIVFGQEQVSEALTGGTSRNHSRIRQFVCHWLYNRGHIYKRIAKQTGSKISTVHNAVITLDGLLQVDRMVRDLYARFKWHADRVQKGEPTA